MDMSVLGFSGLWELPNFHPVFVHFPIALLPVTLLFYAIGIFLNRPAFLLFGRICLYFAIVGGVLAIATGLKADIPVNNDIGTLLYAHYRIGQLIFVVAVVLLAWSFFQAGNKPRGSLFFLVVLLFINCLALQNADIGSRMVYLHGAGVKPMFASITGGQGAK